jgi:hypothetical protein
VRPEEPADGPAAIVGPRKRSRRWPHTDAEVAAVRRLIEQTTLTHREIATRIGIGVANISRWRIAGGWQRPPFAPRATDTVPTARASAKLKRRMLATRLDALAQRHVRELEQSACVDPGKLAEALELLKMARLAASPRWRRRLPGNTAGPKRGEPSEPTRPIMELCASEVDLHRAPKAAVEDFLAHREPPKEKPPRVGRGRRSTRNQHHAWMLESDSSA